MTEPPANSDDDYEYNGESFEEASSDEDDITEVGTDCSSGSHSESESELRDFKIKQNATLGIRMNNKNRAVGFDRNKNKTYSSSSGDEEEVIVAETIVELNNLSIPMEDSQFSDRTLIADNNRVAEYNPDALINREPIVSGCDLEDEDSVQIIEEEEKRKTEVVYEETQYESQWQFGNIPDFTDKPSCSDDPRNLINQEEQMHFALMEQNVVECEESVEKRPEKLTTDLNSPDFTNEHLNASDDDTEDRACDAILANISKMLFGQSGMGSLKTDDLAQQIQNQPEMIKLLQSLDKNMIERLTTDSAILKDTIHKRKELTKSPKEQTLGEEDMMAREDGSGDAGRCLKPPTNEYRKFMQPTQFEMGNFEVEDESEFKELVDSVELGTDFDLPDERSLDYDITSQTPTSFNTEDYALHVDILRRPSTSTSTEKMRSTPLSFKNLGRKSFSFTNSQVREIERQNNILLKKMISIKPTIPKNTVNQTKFVDQPPSTRTTSAAVNRKKQQRQIDKDNTVLRRKLEAIGTRRREF